MKYISCSFSVLLAVMFVVGTLPGCDSLTDGHDQDPNFAYDSPAALNINGMQLTLVGLHETHMARVAGMWVDQFTGASGQYTGLNQYTINADEFNGEWGEAYANILAEAQEVKESAREANDDLTLGITQVLQAHTYGTMAALFGDVPLNEVGQGKENLNPGFQDQDIVYEQLTDSLETAIANINAGSGSGGPGSNDIFFGGSAGPWTEVAHTLLARYELHQGNYQAALDAANKGITTQDNEMIAPHGGTRDVDMNTWYSFLVLERADYLIPGGASAQSRLDSRENAKTDESARKAYYYGGPSGQLNYESGAYQPDSPFPLVTRAENELIRAEAILQIGDETTQSVQQDAIAALNNAREANDGKYAPRTDNYQAYVLSDFQSGGIARPPDVSSTANAILEEILEEKYFSLIGRIEVFNDVRRTDNFIDVPTKGENITGLPQRFPLPQVSRNANDNAPDDPARLDEETPVNSAIDYSGF